MSLLLLDEKIQDMLSAQERDMALQKNQRESISKIRFINVNYSYKTAVADEWWEDVDKSVFGVNNINLEFNKGSWLE